MLKYTRERVYLRKTGADGHIPMKHLANSNASRYINRQVIPAEFDPDPGAQRRYLGFAAVEPQTPLAFGRAEAPTPA